MPITPIRRRRKNIGDNMSDKNSGLSIFTIPENPVTSKRFIQRFNESAQELGLPIKWVDDSKNPLAVDAFELVIEKPIIYALKNSTTQTFNDKLADDVKRILTNVEEKRLELVRQSAISQEIVIFRPPLELLTPVEKRAVELFQFRVKPALDRIEAKQHDPNADILSTYSAKFSDHYSKILFSRFHRDTCAGFNFVLNPACSLFPFYPDQPPLNGMIDPKISMEQVRGLSTELLPAADELRPTTILAVNANGKINSIPLPLHPLFKEDHLELAQALEEIAGLDVSDRKLDPALVDQLIKWAKFFRTGSAEDERLAMQATIDAGNGSGTLRVNLGPSESYWDDNMKFPYVLQVGIRNEQLSQELNIFQPTIQKVEASLKDVPYYEPRTISSRGGFAEVLWLAVSGGSWDSFAFGQPKGNNYPNYNGYPLEGSNRFIVMEGADICSDDFKKGLSAISDVDVSAWTDKSAFVRFAVNHETGHLLGPQRDHVLPNGERTASKFASHWADADEPKADLTGVMTARVLYEEGTITKNELIGLINTPIAMNFSMRYKGKKAFAAGGAPAHFFGHMIEVGMFFKSGAYSLTDDSPKKIHIDYDKYLTASEHLWKMIIKFQASGDVDGFIKMSNELVTFIPDEADRLILSNTFKTNYFIERHL